MKSARRKVLESVSAFAVLVAFAASMPAAFAEEVAADEAREAARGWAGIGGGNPRTRAYTQVGKTAGGREKASPEAAAFSASETTDA